MGPRRRFWGRSCVRSRRSISAVYSERYHFTPTVDGDYYIEVAAASSSGPFNTGRYWLTLTEAP